MMEILNREYSPCNDKIRKLRYECSVRTPCLDIIVNYVLEKIHEKCFVQSQMVVLLEVNNRIGG
jgi:hypothetical protein